MEPHDLFGLPLDQFTNQRNALAKELRQEGRRDEAAAVAKLRKPSVAAWAVNQLVRTQRRDVDVLLEAGDALQRAQADLLAHRGDSATLRRAVEAERAAVERLVARARGLLDSDGHELTAPRLEQVTETLTAAALDEDARARVRDGCLDRELRHVGLGSLGAPSSGASEAARGPRASARSRPGPKRDRRPKQAARQEEAPAARQEEARAARQERAAKEKAAREAEAAARRRVDRANRRQQTAEHRRERAAAELRDAEEALASAQDATAEAETELSRAEKLRDEL
jgi:hypothetical protein